MDFSLIVFYLGIIVVPGLLVSSLGSVTSSKWRLFTRRAKPARFPGPKQYPIIGRIHDLPRFSMWLKFKEWADIHGPIYETSMMGLKFIVISDEEMATELLVKKGNNFAGRPQIRALIDHKLGPVYEALQDRNGMKRVYTKTARAHKV